MDDLAPDKLTARVGALERNLRHLRLGLVVTLSLAVLAFTLLAVRVNTVRLKAVREADTIEAAHFVVRSHDGRAAAAFEVHGDSGAHVVFYQKGDKTAGAPDPFGSAGSILVLVGDPHGSYLSMHSPSSRGRVFLATDPVLLLGRGEPASGAFFVQSNGEARLDITDSLGVVHSFPPLASTRH
jgi:hypothetical protein